MKILTKKKWFPKEHKIYFEALNSRHMIIERRAEVVELCYDEVRQLKELCEYYLDYQDKIDCRHVSDELVEVNGLYQYTCKKCKEIY